MVAERAKRADKKVQPPPSGLVAQFKTAPKLSDSKMARARVDGWLSEIASSKAGKAIKQLVARPREGNLGNIVAAIAEASPYLWDSIRADPDRFLALLEADPDARFARLIAEVQRAPNA